MDDLKDLFEHGKWYHCFRHEGLISNGTYDIEKYIHLFGFEKDYSGKTILDVGSSDGYFSIWMKQHNAQKVCAIDSNKYDGTVAIEAASFRLKNFEQKYAQYAEDYTRFRLIYDRYALTNSNKLLLMAKLKAVDIDYRTGSIYDLKPYGKFDIVMCNDLLEHLRDPITAIEELYNATNSKCIFSVSSAIKPRLFMNKLPLLLYKGHQSGGSFYNLSEAAVSGMCKSAGFTKTEVVSRFDMLNETYKTKVYHFILHAYK